MKNITSKIEHRCSQDCPCFYRKGNSCTFWEEVEIIPAAWNRVFPDDDCDLRYIDTFREPCLYLNEARWESCRGFYNPRDEGWLKCEDCKESLCSYMEQPFEVGDTLGWLRDKST